MDSESASQEAIRNLNGHDFHGRKMKVRCFSRRQMLSDCLGKKILMMIIIVAMIILIKILVILMIMMTKNTEKNLQILLIMGKTLPKLKRLFSLNGFPKLFPCLARIFYTDSTICLLCRYCQRHIK